MISHFNFNFLQFFGKGTIFKQIIFASIFSKNVNFQPVLEKDLGWMMEKVSDFRYPPYDPKRIGFIRTLTKNR